MLRRLKLKLIWILCFGALFASVPVGACCFQGAPMHDCCPHGQHAPQLANQTSPLGLSLGAEICCTTGAAGSVAMTLAAGKPDARPSARHSHLPPLMVAYAHQLVAASLIHFTRGCDSRAYFPSRSTLYLSTGRLRL
jgi:hypothetical protein